MKITRTFFVSTSDLLALKCQIDSFRDQKAQIFNLLVNISRRHIHGTQPRLDQLPHHLIAFFHRHVLHRLSLISGTGGAQKLCQGIHRIINDGGGSHNRRNPDGQ